MALPLILSLAGTGVQAAGAEADRAATLEGAKSAQRQTRAGTQFAEGILNEALDLQRPFIEAGQAALPLSELAARGEADFRDTPIFRAREETGLAGLLEAIQGDELSGFGADRFRTGLDASEQQSNTARLQDLLNIGLGASGAAGQTSGTLADIASAAALQGGNLRASGAQSAFEQRQNAINQGAGSLSGLPSFFAATRQ